MGSWGIRNANPFGGRRRRKEGEEEKLDREQRKRDDFEVICRGFWRVRMVGIWYIKDKSGVGDFCTEITETPLSFIQFQVQFPAPFAPPHSFQMYICVVTFPIYNFFLHYYRILIKMNKNGKQKKKFV